MADPERYSLNGHPEFTRVLDRIAAEIAPGTSSQEVSSITFRYGDQLSSFLLTAENFEVVRNDEDGGPGCIVCELRKKRHYQFYVQCEDGQWRGPVGSSCVFKHVLGIERAQAWGRALHTLVRRVMEPPVGQADLAVHEDEEFDYDGYLRRLSLPYLLDSEVLRRASLTQNQLSHFEQCRDTGRPLPVALYTVLKAKGKRITLALTQRPLLREVPYRNHPQYPLTRPVDTLPLRFDDDVNIKPFTMSFKAGWTEDGPGNEYLCVQFTREGSPYYEAAVLRLTTSAEGKAFGRFLTGLPERVSEHERKYSKENDLKHLSTYAHDGLRIHAWYGRRMRFPVQDDGTWSGKHVFILDVFEERRPAKQSIRFYESRDGTMQFAQAYVSLMTEAGQWVTEQSQLLS